MNIHRSSLANISVIGQNFTVGPLGSVTSPKCAQQVIVTPISSETYPYISQQKSQLHDIPYCIEKVLLKAVCRGTKKELKTFMLRNINTEEVCSSDRLKWLIKNQLQGDVGVVHGNSVVLVCNRKDVMDVWKDIKRGSKDYLVWWIKGLQPKV